MFGHQDDNSNQVVASQPEPVVSSDNPAPVFSGDNPAPSAPAGSNATFTPPTTDDLPTLPNHNDLSSSPTISHSFGSSSLDVSNTEATAEPETPAPAAPVEEESTPAPAVTPAVTSSSDSPSSDSATSKASAGSDSDDLVNIKQQALQQLQPLVGHLEQTPEEKFRTTMMMIQASDDQSLIQTAYQAAQDISDEKVRAQALLDVVNEINYFTQHPTTEAE